ncbi:hypothetical protein NDU88_010474 [Pleurodeles waltl]|uniref:TIL domain-containing protein n=1 Tax=Pleurodeles waltl TaxID=8319 RepID=A0AAV7PV12_PLEWA|nr:hypothetical protein NDU88_010474 [Pleurodeles waltl]
MVKHTYYLLGLAAVLIAMLGTIKCDDDDDGDDDDKKCDENMEFSPCGRSCQRTCQNISNMGPTKSCKEECKPGCSCVLGGWCPQLADGPIVTWELPDFYPTVYPEVKVLSQINKNVINPPSGWFAPESIEPLITVGRYGPLSCLDEND